MLVETPKEMVRSNLTATGAMADQAMREKQERAENFKRSPIKTVLKDTVENIAMLNPVTGPIYNLYKGSSVIPRALSVAPESISRSVSNKAKEMSKAEVLKPSPEFEKSAGIGEDIAGAVAQVGFQALPYIATSGPAGVARYGLKKAGKAVPKLLQKEVTSKVGKALASSVMGGYIMGSQYEQLIDEGVDTDRAFKASFVNMALQMPMEYASLGKVIKAWQPKRALGEKVRDLLESMVTEGVTEFSQSFPEAATDIYAKNPDQGTLQKVAQFINELPQTIKQAAYEGLIGAAAAGVLGGAGAALSSTKDKERGPYPTKVDMGKLTEDLSNGKITVDDVAKLRKHVPNDHPDAPALDKIIEFPLKTPLTPLGTSPLQPGGIPATRQPMPESPRDVLAHRGETPKDILLDTQSPGPRAEDQTIEQLVSDIASGPDMTEQEAVDSFSPEELANLEAGAEVPQGVPIPIQTTTETEVQPDSLSPMAEKAKALSDKDLTARIERLTTSIEKAKSKGHKPNSAHERNLGIYLEEAQARSRIEDDEIQQEVIPDDEEIGQGTEEAAAQGRTEDQGGIEGIGPEPVKAGTSEEAETNADVGLDRSVQGEVTPDNGKKEPWEITYEKVQDTKNLKFTEKEQHRVDNVKERFPDVEDMPPITMVDGIGIIDGHNRAKIAQEENKPINTISIPKELYDELKEKGFDEIEISYAMLRDKGYSQEAMYLDDQFPGAGVEKQGEKAFDILISAQEKAIKKALKEGKSVPPEVLKDYPDLVSKADELKPGTPTNKESLTVETPVAETNMPAYRDWRYNTVAENSANIIPNRPGQKFTDEQKKEITSWANSIGLNTIEKGNVIHVVGPIEWKVYELDKYGASGVKSEKRKAEKVERAAIEESKKLEKQRVYDNSPSKEWIENIFGTDFTNTYNKAALSRYLDGTEKDFKGIANHKWRDGITKLGLNPDTSNFKDIKKAYESYKSPPVAKNATRAPVKSGKVAPAEAGNKESLTVEPNREVSEPLPKSEKSKTIKPKAEKKASESTADELLAEFDRQAAEIEAREKEQAEATKPVTAKEKATETVDHLKAIIDGAKKINEILGDVGALSNDKIDQTKWEQIKPVMAAMWDHAVKAGKSSKEFVSLVLEHLGTKARPYFAKFVREELSQEGKGVKEDVSGLSEDNAGVHQEIPEAEEGTVGEGEGVSGLSGGSVRQPGDSDLEGNGEGQSSTGRNIGKDKGSEPKRDGSKGNNSGRTKRVPKQPVVKSNYRITDQDNVGKGGWKKKGQDNVEAIRTLKKVLSENRPATAEEKAKLVKYVGWGASELANNIFPKRKYAPGGYVDSYREGWEDLGKELKSLLSEEEYSRAKGSTPNAHYTSPAIIKGMYRALESMGFKGGRILEPGSGVGHFIGLLPDSLLAKTKFTGIELDNTSAAIAKTLYPDENIRNIDFTQFSVPDGFYDVVIGNPPFGDVKITSDRKYAKHRFALHDYFMAKSMDKLRPGGVMVLVTSRYTMDKMNDKARSYLSDSADLIGAVRLPQTAFKENAGTEVVTDVIFLRKRLDGEKSAGEAWKNTTKIKVQGTETSINEYFKKNPDMILGKNAMTGSMYAENTYTVEPYKSIDIGESFNKATDKFSKDIYKNEAIESVADRDPKEYDFAPSYIKENAYYIDEKGNLLNKQEGIGTPVTRNIPLLKRFVRLRDAYKNVLHVQLKENGTDEELSKAQTQLSKHYEAFVKNHGPINKHTVVNMKNGTESIRYPNITAINKDPNAQGVASLEIYSEATGKATKADIFTKRVIRPEVTPKIETVEDAYLVSLVDKGYVDLDHISKLYGETEDVVVEGLGDLIFKNPKNQKWESRDEYLSGNVRTKLSEAQAAAEEDESFSKNVKALEGVIPEDKPHTDIEIRLGMPIISPEIIEDFAESLGIEHIKITYLPSVGTWALRLRSGGFIQYDHSVNSTAEWGTQRINAQGILERLLNNQPIKVTDTIDKKPVLNQDETNNAIAKAQAMKEKFAEWIWEDAGRTDAITRAFNDHYNCFVKRDFSGQHLDKMTFPGMSNAFTPYEHQKRVAWRIVQQGNTYMAHSVGAGKTIASIMSGMEMKRLGIKKKPTWVVPNHMLRQFSNEFLELYPTAKILVADEENFSKANRNRFMGRIAAENWDGIIITHSAFGKIPVDPAVGGQYIEEMIRELETIMSETDDRTTLKQIERAKKRLEQRLKKMLSADSKDTGLTFEETGIDQIFVDEAQEFRKVDFVTNQPNIKGVDPQGSMKAMDLYLKSRHLESLYPGRSLVLMSGTPVTNTLGEVFTIQRFLQEDLLKEEGLNNFDAWASMFGNIVSNVESTVGGYKTVSRFAKFSNMTEMSQMWGQIGDYIRTQDLPYITLPKVNTGARQIIDVPQTPLQEEYKITLRDRVRDIENRKGPAKKGDDIILSVITDGRHAAIDERYINNRMQPNPDSKLETCISKVYDIWKKTEDTKSVQMIFSDLGVPGGSGEQRGFSAYKRIKDALVARGISENEIAFMQNYKKSAQKQKLFDKLNSGEVRIIIGSSQAMGTGVNAQKKLVALHHLDPDNYLPAMIEQREGRIIRQGNENLSVDIYAYVTKGSHDEIMWQFLETKQRFIDQFLRGEAVEKDTTDIDGAADSYAFAKAMSSDNPLLLEQAGLENEVNRLESLRRAHEQTQLRLRRTLQYSKEDILSLKERIEKLKDTIESRSIPPKGEFNISIGKSRYSKREDAGNAIIRIIEANAKKVEPGHETSFGTIGEYAGLSIGCDVSKQSHSEVISTTIWVNSKTGLRDHQTLRLEETSPMGIITRIENLAKGFDQTLKNTESALANVTHEAEVAKEKVGAKFQHQGSLDEKKDRLKEILKELVESENQSKAPASTPLEIPDQTGDDNTSDIRASNIGSPPETHLAKHVVENIARQITGKWKNVGVIEVVQSQDELPDVVWTSGNFNRHTSIIRGVFISGWKSDRRIILVADNIENRKQLTHTILEETLGHDGIRQTLGKDYDTFLYDVYNDYAEGIEPVAAHYKLDTKKRKDRIEATDEWLAKQIAGDALPAKVWARIVRLFRQFLRKIDPHVTYTVNEIKDLARNAIKKGVKENQGQNIGVNEFAVSARFSIDKAMKSIRDNPNFRKWFGKSKTIDKDGNPIVFYHGTSYDFSEFDPKASTIYKDAKNAMFFTSKASVADSYLPSAFYTPDQKTVKKAYSSGSNIMPVYIKMENPMVVDYFGGGYKEGQYLEYIKEAKKDKKDGVIFTNVRDVGVMSTGRPESSHIVVAFSPTQIKSIYNTGEFNPADPDIRRQMVYHGTPHVWPPEPGFPHGRPRLDKIGSGEGMQAYGHGWYSSETEEVGKEYQEGLSSSFVLGLQHLNSTGEWFIYDSPSQTTLAGPFKTREEASKYRTAMKAGSLYRLDIPDAEIPKLLDWDKPLSEQSEYVKKALKPVRTDKFDLNPEDGTDIENGATSYYRIAGELGSDKAASEYLVSIGIPGNKYLDGMSRSDGKGSYNYVIWDQDVLDQIAMLERNGDKLDAIREADKAEAQAEALQVRFNASNQSKVIDDILPPEVADRYRKAKVDPPSKFQKAKEALGRAWTEREHFPLLESMQDKAEAARVKNILREHQEIPETAKKEAEKAMMGFLKGLSKDGYETFRLNIFLGDMVKDINSGLLEDGNLPFGFKTTQEVMTSYDKAQDKLSQDKSALKSYQARQKYINDLKSELVKYKILNKEVLKHEDYYHHQVLLFWNALSEKGEGRKLGVGSQDVRGHWRPWMAARKGSMLDYNTEYVEAEFFALSQQIAQLETAKTLEKIQKESDVFNSLQASAKSQNTRNAIKIFDAAGLTKMSKKGTLITPLTAFKQKIAVANKNLAGMAKRGELEYDTNFSNIVEQLAMAHEDPDMEVNDPRWFNFLSYLIAKKKPGAGWAATILKAIKDRDALIKETLGDSFLTYKKLMPEGYVEWQPDPKKGWFWANTVTDSILQKVMSGEKMLEDKDVRPMLAKGRNYVWVIPEGLASTLDNFNDNDYGKAWPTRWSAKLLSAWKQFILLNPYSVIRYNINNMSGDFDAAFAYNARVTKPKSLFRASRDLWRWMHDKEVSPELQAELDEARKRGVIGSGWSVQEVKDVFRIMSTDRIVKDLILGEDSKWYTPQALGRGYWNTVKTVTAWRENIIRLSAYRFFKEEIAQGKIHYGATKRKGEIDAITGTNEKAAKLARELLGDYGNISHAGEYIRKRMIPFYSWMEINAPRYVYMAKNLKYQGETGVPGRLAVVTGKKVAGKAALWSLRAAGLYLMVNIWNRLFFPDEEDELGEANRRQLHLILGRNSDGTISSIRFQGALSDALSWFGMEDLPSDMKDLVKGKGSIQEKLIDIPKAFATRVINGSRPEYKILYEILTGRSLYPDPFRARPVRDRTEYALRNVKLGQIYNLAAGKPRRGGTVASQLARDLKSLVIYQSDPGEQAYYDTRSMVFDYLGKRGESRESPNPTSRSNALYYYRQAIKYGDIRAAEKYLKIYKEDFNGKLGNLAASVKRAHPLSSLPKMLRYGFRKSLSPEDQERVAMAIKWYNETYLQRKNMKK
jgi:N12 class adenine-specific DNA methylase/predicted RNA methylase